MSDLDALVNSLARERNHYRRQSRLATFWALVAMAGLSFVMVYVTQPQIEWLWFIRVIFDPRYTLSILGGVWCVLLITVSAGFLLRPDQD